MLLNRLHLEPSFHKLGSNHTMLVSPLMAIASGMQKYSKINDRSFYLDFTEEPTINPLLPASLSLTPWSYAMNTFSSNASNISLWRSIRSEHPNYALSSSLIILRYEILKMPY